MVWIYCTIYGNPLSVTEHIFHFTQILKLIILNQPSLSTPLTEHSKHSKIWLFGSLGKSSQLIFYNSFSLINLEIDLNVMCSPMHSTPPRVYFRLLKLIISTKIIYLFFFYFLSLEFILGKN
jgi:hypothetical protein